MRMNDFDRRFADNRRRIDRMARINMVIATISFALIAALVVVGLYLIVMSPETIGAWFGRVASGFKAAR